MTGEELKSLREKLGFTQTEMGGKLGITASAVAHMESGKNKITQQTEMLAEMLCDKP
jgi:transcriptional regulator with XRE-family HTH domain